MLVCKKNKKYNLLACISAENLYSLSRPASLDATIQGNGAVAQFG